jgi:hypothetical protein
MAHRTFTDGQGREWEVWEVRPGLALIPGGVDRRRPRPESGESLDEGEADVAHGEHEEHDRRRRDRRLAVSPPLRGGWLAFRRGGGGDEERRRLAPVPAGWDRESDARLAEYCRAAQVVTRMSVG